ncbi:MAG: hypothetical protein PHH47_09980 [Gallionella sp.]|nr:hypothetical protein [Gallionella sp.]MDD4947206.1 hypothetical protein [Gallionella sp.]MDD5611880.1 hypothetical protein [Gallionella sp.]
MAYVVKKSTDPRIVRNWPVVIQIAEDEGKIRKEEIFVDYEVLSQSEVDDIMRSAQLSGDNIDVALLRRAVKSINGVVDEANNPVPFNEESFSEALDRANQRMAMVGSFFDVQSGRKPARKNS